MIRFSQMSACGDLPVLSALVLLSYPVYAQSQSAENLPKISSAELQQSSAKSATQVERERLARAQEQLNRQERQRILGIIPNFGTSLIPDAETLSPYQKLHLALKSTLDPFQVLASGIDAGLSQHSDDFPGYRQGATGYGKRFTASYVDAFNATVLGGAVFPVLLHQDPRYFRLGSGTFGRRLIYAISMTVKAKGDNKNWQPNYSNLLGNLAAGAISNAYYPSGSRGLALTFERALSESAQSGMGNVMAEFWPDISRKLFHGSR